ncbi:MAG: hypothetical protein U1U88_002478 [Lawsonella clevelandensis]
MTTPSKPSPTPMLPATTLAALPSYGNTPALSPTSPGIGRRLLESSAQPAESAAALAC